jgi:hypothetical protein
MTAPLRLVVLGMMGRSPFGGQTWLYVNWLRGLRALGHEVWYVEDDEAWPYDPVAGTTTDDCVYAVDHVGAVMELIGMPERWAYRFRGEERTRTWGLTGRQLDNLYRSCDAILNVVGATELHDVHMEAPRRVYVQTDPVHSELMLAGGDRHTIDAFAAHDVIVSYGENYGAADCRVPLNGAAYGRTRQPVDLDLWPMTFTPQAPAFTTIGNYRTEGYDVEFDGDVYHWSKHHEWERFLTLPRLTKQRFELAISNATAEDLEVLHAHGWRTKQSARMSLDVFGAYRRYIQTSRAEFTVAKDQNVRLRSGWFSERDACYLASGKPVIAQDTGFGCALPTGDGLFAVSDVEEAAEAVDRINADYRHHSRAARAIAQDYFAAPKVAAAMLAEAGIA